MKIGHVTQSFYSAYVACELDDQQVFCFVPLAYGMRMPMVIVTVLLGALKMSDSVRSEPPPRLISTRKQCVNPRCVVNHEPIWNRVVKSANRMKGEPRSLRGETFHVLDMDGKIGASQPKAMNRQVPISQYCYGVSLAI